MLCSSSRFAMRRYRNVSCFAALSISGNYLRYSTFRCFAALSMTRYGIFFADLGNDITGGELHT